MTLFRKYEKLEVLEELFLLILTYEVVNNLNKTHEAKMGGLEKENSKQAVIICFVIGGVIGIGFTATAFVLEDTNPWFYILPALGTSIIASIIFFITYSFIAEKNIMREISKTAIDYSSQQFSKLFEDYLPSKTYPKTSRPTEEFKNDFEDCLRKSKLYYFIGDAGSYTSYRIYNYSKTGGLLDKDIKILMIDPREKELINQRVQNEYPELCDHEEFENKAKDFRLKIFASLQTLYEVSTLKNIEVGFHKEHLVFRCEILSDGLFITYRLGGEALNTHFYKSNTILYNAYRMNFSQCWDSVSAKSKMVLKHNLTQTQFGKWLQKFGCEMSVNDLEKYNQDRLVVHKSHL